MRNLLRQRGLILTLSLLVAGGALVSLGTMDPHTDLGAVAEVWGDVLRDADQATLRVTRVSDEAEMRFGQELRGRLLLQEDPVWTPYVAAVGAALMPYVRRHGIRYEFHAIAGPEINAFALPGGQIYIFTGMLGFLQSESELATVLGHEISHVDLRHCIERYQYELAARKIGLGQIGQVAQLALLPYKIGYLKYQEIEADEQGARLSAEAGYDPSVAPVVFSRMHKALGEPDWQRAQTPAGEVAGAVRTQLAAYVRSHPASDERSVRLNELLVRNRGWLRGREVYEGLANYQQRTARSQQEFPGERRRL
jgi:predicted Zn-dependent protease